MFSITWGKSLFDILWEMHSRIQADPTLGLQFELKPSTVNVLAELLQAANLNTTPGHYTLDSTTVMSWVGLIFYLWEDIQDTLLISTEEQLGWKVVTTTPHQRAIKTLVMDIRCFHALKPVIEYLFSLPYLAKCLQEARKFSIFSLPV